MLVNATRTTSPMEEPVTVEQVKLHLREDLVDSANDAYIQGLIEASRRSLEDRLSLCLVTTDWVSKFQTTDGAMLTLPLQPVQEVASVTYTDTDGATQTLSPSTYTVNLSNFPVRIRPKPGSVWPYGTDFIVAYTAGYGDTASMVPAQLRQWVMMVVSDMYRHRETTITAGTERRFQFAEHLLDPFYPYEV